MENGLTKGRLIAAAWQSNSLEDFAARMGRELTDDFIGDVMELAPGIEADISAREECAEARAALARGDIEGRNQHVKLEIAAVNQAITLGYSRTLLAASPDAAAPRVKAAKAAVKPARPAGKEKPSSPPRPRVKAETQKLEPLAEGDCVCSAVRDDALGYTGDSFCGRRIILFRKRQGVFGGTAKGERLRRYTLHNGIPNMSDLRGDKPTVYWAVLDAMIDMKAGFTKPEVVAAATKTMSSVSKASWSEKAAGIAFDVLKTHETHPTKRGSGMCHHVDDTTDDRGGETVMTLRPRRADETMAKFQRDRKSLADAKASGGPAKVEVVKEFS